jgi:hypothetical protein
VVVLPATNRGMKSLLQTEWHHSMLQSSKYALENKSQKVKVKLKV